MTQFSRPVSDVQLGGWSNPSWSVIDEGISAFDGVLASSPNKSDGILICSLSSVTDPEVGTGHSLAVRGYVASNGVSTINIALKSAGSTIKTWTPAWTTSIADYSIALTSGEADSISDYSTLTVEIHFDYTSGGTGRGFIDAFELLVPDAEAEPITVFPNVSTVSSSAQSTAVSPGEVNIPVLSSSLTLAAQNSSVDSPLPTDYYEVQRHSGDLNWQTIATPDIVDSSYDDSSGLEDGTTYTYRIRLVEGGSEGNWSNEASVVFTISPTVVNLDSANLSLSAQQEVSIPGSFAVSLVFSSISLSAQSIILAPGSVDVVLLSASISVTPQNSSADSGAIEPITITLDSAVLLSSAQTETSIGGDSSLILISSSLATEAQDLTVVAGDVVVSVQGSSILSSPQNVVGAPEVVVILNSSTVAALPQNSSSIPGSVTVQVESSSISSQSESILSFSSLVFILLDSAVIGADAQKVTYPPSHTSVGRTSDGRTSGPFREDERRRKKEELEEEELMLLFAVIKS